MALKILLIDTDADRAQALEEKLSESGFAQILRLPERADLGATVETTKPDLIIIDMALPDRDALEDIRAVSAAHPIVDRPGPEADTGIGLDSAPQQGATFLAGPVTHSAEVRHIIARLLERRTAADRLCGSTEASLRDAKSWKGIRTFLLIRRCNLFPLLSLRPKSTFSSRNGNQPLVGASQHAWHSRSAGAPLSSWT